MASLVIKFADLAKGPVGSGRDVSAEVLALHDDFPMIPARADLEVS